MFVPQTLPQVLSEIQSGRKRLPAGGCVQDKDANTDGTSQNRGTSLQTLPPTPRRQPFRVQKFYTVSNETLKSSFLQEP